MGVVEEVLIDGESGRWGVPVGEIGPHGDVIGANELAGRFSRFLPMFADAEHQQIGDDFRACDPAEGAGWKANRADQVSSIGHSGASVGSRCVGGVPTGEQSDVTAGGGEVQRFDDEVVVDGVLAPVVGVVPQLDVAEWDVSDCGNERIVGYRGVGERFIAHLGTGI